MTQDVGHRQQMDRIFALLLPRAKELLEANDGRFYPVGASLDRDGALHASASAYEGLQPDRVVDRIVEGFRREARGGRLTACGVSFDAQMERKGGERTDAIATWLEHMNGESVVIYAPYRRVASGKFEYGGLVAADSPARVWGT